MAIGGAAPHRARHADGRRQTSRRTSRGRRRGRPTGAVVALVLGLGALVGVAPVGAGPAAAALPPAATIEDQFFALLNRTRAVFGRPPMSADAQLEASSAQWSTHMADTQLLVHDPDLGAKLRAIDPTFTHGGENIGRGGDVDALWRAFMNSTSHRAEILGTSNRVGVAVVVRGNTIWITFRFLAAGSVPPPPLPPPPPAAPTGTGYHPLAPARILDSRTGTGMPAAYPTPIGPGGTVVVDVTGVGGVPASGVSAVAVNVTATNGSATSHLRLYPYGTALPGASTVNFAAAQTTANMVLARVGTDGSVAIYNNSGSVHVVVDVLGWFDTSPTAGGLRFTPVTPARVVDTRAGAPIGSGATISRTVGGTGGVPSDATAVVVNVTATNPTSATGTHLTVFPTGASRPGTSTVNAATNAVAANLAIVPLGTGGALSVYNNAGTAHVLMDVVGWFDDGVGAGYGALTPARILDTRSGVGRPAAGAVSAGGVIELTVRGVGGVPASATSVALNLTATQGTATTHLTAHASGTDLPTTSNLNVPAGTTAANLVVVPIGADGMIRIRNNSGAIQVIGDVVGSFGP